jgi:hypothetical protein
MNLDHMPIWVILILSILLVMISIESCYRLGHRSRRRSEEEKESPVSAIAGSVLGLLAFMMVFTFGIVSDRYNWNRFRSLQLAQSPCLTISFSMVIALIFALDRPHGSYIKVSQQPFLDLIKSMK